MTTACLCRACGAPLEHVVADLGLSPVSNAFVRTGEAHRGEMFHPLQARVCTACWLVQLAYSPEASTHFHDDYVYFSSYSTTWVDHARRFVEMACARFALGPQSKVMELASNDGYLLQHVVRAGIPCIGIEPSANTAAAARARGVDSRPVFFGRRSAADLAAEGWMVDLLIGNNVLAHVPDINDFVGAMPLVLRPDGVVSLEFPHLERLIEGNQFDTVYHEHYSYLSLTALIPVFSRAGMRVFDVEHLPTHGGSLRILACHSGARHADTPAVANCLARERAAGLTSLSTYARFAERVRETKRALLDFLIAERRRGKRIVGYGAAAKGNTLLNYCGAGTDFIDFVADKNPAKQGRLLPGTRIPVRPPDDLVAARPDHVLILPWNIRDEIIAELDMIRGWGGRFVVAIPRLEVIA